MSDLTFSALWCAGQVALISALMFGVSVICLRRSPNAVSHIIGWAAVVVLGVTILIPCRWPAGWRWATSEVSREPISIRSTSSVHSTEPSIEEPVQPAIGFSLNPDQLLSPVRQLQQAPAPLGPRLGLCLAWLLGAGSVWSLTRLALGLWAIRSLRRHATPLIDPELQQLAEKMLLELHCPQPLSLAESSRVDGAAVVGFLRPVVLLSDRWRSWSPDEQRAVLAHELAHVSRRDALWRLAANLGAAIHFYNPLLRGLLRRLILAQELVADRLAIPLAGGQGCYLRALSGLALRQDAELRGQPETLMIPVFSGHWLRRIEMLKAMDCVRPRPMRGWLAMSVVATIVAFGLATTAMRAWAQDEARTLPLVDGKQGSSNAPPPAPGELTSAPAEDPIQAIPQKVSLFKNPRVPASELGFSKAGAMHLDLAGLRRTATRGVVIDAYIQMLLELSYVNLSAQALDSLTGNLVFLIGYDPQLPEGRRGEIQAGADRFILRANQDLDLRTLSQSIPDSNIKQVAGREIVEVSMPFLGPAPFLLKRPDPRTLWIGFPEVDAATIATPAWADDWDAVSGGLVTLLIRPDVKVPGQAFEEELSSEIMCNVCRNIDVLAIGIDIAEDEPRIEFQVRLNCGTSDKALQVLAAIQAGIAVAETFRDSAPGPIPDDHQMLWNALAHAKITRPADQQQIIQASTFAVLPDSMLKEMRDAVTAELGQIRENRRLEPGRVMPPDSESVR